MAAPIRTLRFCQKSFLKAHLCCLEARKAFTSAALNPVIYEDQHSISLNCPIILKRCQYGFQCFRCPYATKSERQCWKCGRHNGAAKQETFFCNCGVIQEVPDDIDYFDVMHLGKSYDIDVQDLTEKKRNLQRRLHPDKYGQKSNVEQNLSVQQSTLVNEAFKTLTHPLSRGLYMLHLHGESIEEGNTEVNPEFLMEIMEINEEISDIETDAEAIDLDQKNKMVISALVGKISEAFASSDITLAKDLLSQLQYYENISVKLREVMTDRGIVS